MVEGQQAAWAAAEALREASSAWETECRADPAAFGSAVAAHAYTVMRETWLRELGVHLAVLDQAGAASEH
ncbi:hypothetical protein [Actinokineospora sp.]|uniref:hypothetical protein n=1 Tax=Actinokineospora sp. TaxID=1872133 RepID=UPI004037BC00